MKLVSDGIRDDFGNAFRILHSDEATVIIASHIHAAPIGVVECRQGLEIFRFSGFLPLRVAVLQIHALDE